MLGVDSKVTDVVNNEPAEFTPVWFFFFVGGEEMFEMNLSLKFNSRPEWKSILKPVIVLRSVFSISLTAYLSF